MTTKTQFTNIAIVIGLLMLLVLPVCADAPVVDATTPGRWLNGTDLNIYITGSNFPFPGSGPNYINVTLNQSPLQNVTSSGITYNSPESITASFGPQRIHFGDWNVTVINMTDNSNGTKSNALSVYNDPPTLTSISPANWGYNNTSTFDFTLSGTNFFTTPMVNLSFLDPPHTNITANVIFQDSTRVTGSFNLNGKPAGLYTVNLTNPDGNLSNTLPFTLYCPPPIITNVAPLRGTTDTATQTIVVTGSQFNISVPGSTVELVNGSTSLPVSSFTVGTASITFNVDLSSQQVGPYNITVSNHGPLYNNTTWTQPFRVFYPLPPVILSVDPATHVNTTNTSVVILGDKFQPGAEVFLNRTGYTDINATSVVFVSVNNITCNLTTNGTMEGPWNVIVRNNDTQSSNSIPFVVTSYPASITNLHNTTHLQTSISWSWTDPSSANFDKVMVYLNGTFQTNVTKGVQTYTATGLSPFTEYTIGTHTVANSGVINETWVNATNWTAPAFVSKVGAYQNGVWFLDFNDNFTWDGAPPDRLYFFTGTGSMDWTEVIGDWNADGKSEIGIYKDGIWGLDYNGNGVWDSEDKAFLFQGTGGAGWTPVIGDWNADGRSKVGVYKDGIWGLDYNGVYAWVPSSKAFLFQGSGVTGNTPVIGDWNADGRDKVGVYKDGIWGLDYNGLYAWAPSSKAFLFQGSGVTGNTPVIGDWNADGRSKVGVYKDGVWGLDYNGYYAWDSTSKAFLFQGTGGTGWTPVIGDWNADGRSKVGIYKSASCGLDYNGLYAWAPSSKAFLFGPDAYRPIIGDW